MKNVLTLPNDLARVSELFEFATNFCRRHSLAEGELRRLLVILDEVFSNIVRYGYPNGARGSIVMSLSYRRDRLEIVVKDDGRPFDPLSVAGPDLDLSTARRPTGGLGIHFVRSLVDDARYSRQAGCNRLVLTRRLPPAAARSSR